jgi:hypothetical protein
VGGVAVISIAAIAFLRRRGPEAPGPVPPPVFGAGAPMRIYVCVSVPITRRASVFVHRMRLLTLLTLRTRMTQLRSLGTKEFRMHRQVTTDYLWSDFVLGSHRITEKSESGMQCYFIRLKIVSPLYLSVKQRWLSLYSNVGYMYPDTDVGQGQDSWRVCVIVYLRCLMHLMSGLDAESFDTQEPSTYRVEGSVDKIRSYLPIPPTVS